RGPNSIRSPEIATVPENRLQEPRPEALPSLESSSVASAPCTAGFPSSSIRRHTVPVTAPGEGAPVVPLGAQPTRRSAGIASTATAKRLVMIPPSSPEHATVRLHYSLAID